jgi:hypothetical protein
MAEVLDEFTSTPQFGAFTVTDPLMDSALLAVGSSVWMHWSCDCASAGTEKG